MAQKANRLIKNVLGEINLAHYHKVIFGNVVNFLACFNLEAVLVFYLQTYQNSLLA